MAPLNAQRYAAGLQLAPSSHQVCGGLRAPVVGLADRKSEILGSLQFEFHREKSRKSAINKANLGGFLPENSNCVSQDLRFPIGSKIRRYSNSENRLPNFGFPAMRIP